jgi:hypothetical protein
MSDTERLRRQVRDLTKLVNDLWDELPSYTDGRYDQLERRVRRLTLAKMDEPQEPPK